MNDEIKGILDKLKDNDWYEELDLTGTKWIELTQEETNQLLNYITNLQKANERLKVALKGTTHCYDEEEHKKLKEENESLRTALNGSEEKRKKSIEYITNNKLYTFKYDDEELKCLDNIISDLESKGDKKDE